MHRQADSSFLPALVLLLCSLAPAAAAQPIDIEADRAEFDSQNGTTLFQGNVVLRRGTLTISADRVTLYREAGGVSRTVAEGAPARYSQILPEGGEISAEAQKIEYLASTEQLRLTGKARLQHGKNRFSGERIVYDIRSERVQAESSGNGKRRVRATIYPDEPAQ